MTRRRLPYRFLPLVPLVVCLACGDGDPTAPEVVLETWALQSIDGTPLPVRLEAFERTWVVRADTLFFLTNDLWIRRQILEFGLAGEAVAPILDVRDGFVTRSGGWRVLDFECRDVIIRVVASCVGPDSAIVRPDGQLWIPQTRGYPGSELLFELVAEP